jgi:hypothetical protein
MGWAEVQRRVKLSPVLLTLPRDTMLASQVKSGVNQVALAKEVPVTYDDTSGL